MALKTPNLGLHKIELTDAPPDITVLNQNWDKLDQVAAASQPFVVNLIDNGSGYIADKTFDEVVAAHNAGRTIKLLYTNSEYPLVYTDATCVVFAMVAADESITITLPYTNEVLFNYVRFAPDYSYGTSDLTAGSSALETGKLYFCYE